MGLALLGHTDLPTHFWDDAFVVAAFLINRIPSKVISLKTPYHMMYKSPPNYHLLRVFGCLCYHHLRPYNRHKLQYRSDSAVFLGYSSCHKGYKAMLPSGKIVITRDILFDENRFPYKSASISTSVPSPDSFSIPSHPPFTITLTPTSAHNTIHHTPQILPSPTDILSSDPNPSASSSSPDSNPTNNSLPASTTHPDLVHSPSPATVSSPSPDTPTPHNSHPMTTRAKAGIFKLKLLTVLLPSSSIPKSVSLLPFSFQFGSKQCLMNTLLSFAITHEQ